MSINDIGNKLMGRFFRRVDGVVWDLTTGRLGIETENGIATLEGEQNNAQININMMDQFGVQVPAFAQNTPTGDVAVGDIIHQPGRNVGWVVEKKGKSLVIMDPDGAHHNITPPKMQMGGMMGVDGVMIVRSLASILPGGANGLGQLQSALMPLMMMGSDLDLESVLPMMLMCQTGSFGEGSQNQMPMMLQTMMMAKMLSGRKGTDSFFN